MIKHSNQTSGPVDNSSSPHSLLKTVPYGSVRITGGFWAGRQAVNRRVSLKHGYQMLEKAGNFHNLKMAAGWETGNYSGRNFYDEDVYKWLEALAWELGRRHEDTGARDQAPLDVLEEKNEIPAYPRSSVSKLQSSSAETTTADLQHMAGEVIALIEAAQGPDGYLNSYYQVVEPHRKWANLDFGHELYCAGHLFQAAVAFQRALGDERLLNVSRRLADHIDRVFGPGRKEGACGHPQVEMALVELYRATGERKYLRLARFFVDQRGQRRMKGLGPYGPEYHQDHVPVRQAQAAAGHAVRQMYLNAGVADLYMESGEQALWQAGERLWHDISGSKMYITGGVGSRYDGESFGDPYELPPDQCYCETCAAIGSLMWNWRLLLIRGEGRFADLIERTLYNGILSSPALDGRHYFYVNPLLVRDGRSLRQSTNPSEGTQPAGRPEWHYVACCPPNVMRLFSSLAHYLATTGPTGVQIHQYADAELDLPFAAGRRAALRVETAYPWQGRVEIRIQECDGGPWQLRLRLPGWCRSSSISLNGEVLESPQAQAGYLVLERAWQAGDVVVLELDMPPVLVRPNPRVDAIRGSLAIQRGPLVYCLEGQDQPQGAGFLDLAIDPDAPLQARWRDDLLGGLVVVEAGGCLLDPQPWGDQLYLPLDQPEGVEMKRLPLTAIPYFAWANRGLTSMRVWIPRLPDTAEAYTNQIRRMDQLGTHL